MSTIFSNFESKLSKFKAKVTENNVSQLFSLEYRSPYENQGFLINLSDIPNFEVMQYFGNHVLWSNLTIDVSSDIYLKFDEVEFNCKLLNIKVRKKYSTKDQSDVYTYELFFEKEIDKEMDALFVHYLSQTEEDENGKNHLMTFYTELEYIPPVQTDMFEPVEE
jgi:hypothetical protein